MKRAHCKSPSEQQERLLNRRQLRQIIERSDMTVWRWEKDGLFPRHVSINGRNYWRASEIENWLQNQLDQKEGEA